MKMKKASGTPLAFLIAIRQKSDFDLLQFQTVLAVDLRDFHRVVTREATVAEAGLGKDRKSVV